MFESILSVQQQPLRRRRQKRDGQSGSSRQVNASRLSEEALEKLPEDFGPTEIRDRLRRLDPLRPLHIFLRRELDHLQRLVGRVRADLSSLVRRLTVESSSPGNLSDEAHDTLDCLLASRLPAAWRRLSWDAEAGGCAPLAAWLSELRDRHAQLRAWLTDGRPAVHWLPGYFSPAAFLTSLRQEAVRSHRGWSLEAVQLAGDVTRLAREEAHAAPPEGGVFVHGLALDGAGWDRRNCRLAEAPAKTAGPVQLPLVHLFAVCVGSGGGGIGAGSGDRPKPAGVAYECPVYTRPERQQRHYLCCLQLRSAKEPDHWVVRGAALVLVQQPAAASAQAETK